MRLADDYPSGYRQRARRNHEGGGEKMPLARQSGCAARDSGVGTDVQSRN